MIAGELPGPEEPSDGERGSQNPDGPTPGDDPFEGLVLDEAFIRGASVHEPPARTRAALARHAADQPRTRRRRRASRNPAGAPRPPRLRRVVDGRFVVAGLLAVVAVVAVVAMLDGLSHLGGPGTANHTVVATATARATVTVPVSAQTTSPDRPVNRSDYVAGHCYTWVQFAPDAPASDVPCARPHLFEATTSTAIDIRVAYPLGVAYPSDAEWTAIHRQYCVAPAEAFLGHTLDPDGRFRPSAMDPSQVSWRTGDRVLGCGLQASVPSPTSNPHLLDTWSGDARGVDQSFIYPAGYCLEEGTDHTTVVSCAAPHNAVAIGNIQVQPASDGGQPAAAVPEAQCDAVARAFAGASFQPTDTVRVGWFSISAGSWRAGSRTTTCTVDYVTAAGQPRDVTGDQLRVDPGQTA
jgi:hypothetical protein